MLIYLFYYVGIAGAVPNAVMMERGEHGARLAFSTIFGQAGGTILFVFVLISCLGTCNGLMMGCTRGFYALAARGTGPKPQVLSQVDPSTGMTSNAAAAGLLACAFWGPTSISAASKIIWAPSALIPPRSPIITLYAMYLPHLPGLHAGSQGGAALPPLRAPRPGPVQRPVHGDRRHPVLPVGLPLLSALLRRLYGGGGHSSTSGRASEPAVIGQPGAPRWGLRAFFSGQRGRNVGRSPFFRQRCLGQTRQKRRTQKRRGCESLRFASLFRSRLGRTPGITSF